IVALNNLGWLLALREGKGTEAQALLQAALDSFGPLPSLLDTRAVIYLTLGRSTAAIADLEEAIAETPKATFYFHLAQAHLAGKDRDAALEAFKKAKAQGLRPGQLHALERAAFDRLGRDLEQR